jgi:hypothetical protein
MQSVGSQSWLMARFPRLDLFFPNWEIQTNGQPGALPTSLPLPLLFFFFFPSLFSSLLHQHSGLLRHQHFDLLSLRLTRLFTTQKIPRFKHVCPGF